MGNHSGKETRSNAKIHMAVANRQIDAGDMVPDVRLKVRVRCKDGDTPDAFDWRDIQSADLFRKKKVVMFAIAGAFSTVCACDHIPSFQRRYDDFKALGVDEIYCISVNDAFVMRHFGLTQDLEEDKETEDGVLNPGNFKKIRLIPDGSARFTRAMGMACRWDNLGGFGERSWRYSAYVEDGKVIKMFKEDEGRVEDDSRISPGQLLVADGATLLAFLQQHLENNVTAAVRKDTATAP